jgi:hypothetical protein
MGQRQLIALLQNLPLRWQNGLHMTVHENHPSCPVGMEQHFVKSWSVGGLKDILQEFQVKLRIGEVGLPRDGAKEHVLTPQVWQQNGLRISNDLHRRKSFVVILHIHRERHADIQQPNSAIVWSLRGRKQGPVTERSPEGLEKGVGDVRAKEVG